MTVLRKSLSSPKALESRIIVSDSFGKEHKSSKTEGILKLAEPLVRFTINAHASVDTKNLVKEILAILCSLLKSRRNEPRQEAAKSIAKISLLLSDEKLKNLVTLLECRLDSVIFDILCLCYFRIYYKCVIKNFHRSVYRVVNRV